MKEPSIEPGTDKALEAFVPFLLFSIPSFRLAYTSAPSFPTTDLFLTIARSPVSILSHFSSQVDSLESKRCWLSPLFSLILPSGSNTTPLNYQMQLTLFVLHLAWLYSVLVPDTLSWPPLSKMTDSSSHVPVSSSLFNHPQMLAFLHIDGSPSGSQTSSVGMALELVEM